MGRMNELVNPIDRIYSLLQKVISFGDENCNTNRNESNLDPLARNVWIGALGLDYTESSDLAKYRNSLIEILNLTEQCNQIVKTNSALNHELYDDLLDNVRESIFGIEGLTWEEFRIQFNDHFLLNLRWAAELLSYHSSETVLQSDELNSLKSELDEITKKVWDSSISYDLREAILEGLEAIRRAIFEYELYGAEGLRNAVDKNVGLIHRYLNDFADLTDDDDVGVARSWLDYVWRLDKLASSASNIKQLASPILERILPMLPGSD